MSAELVLFDLDGTLTDSAPGIISSLKLALADLGLPAPDDGVLFGLLGPPFWVSLPTIGVPEERVAEAVEAYRVHFEASAIFTGNSVYPGIVDMLTQLQQRGVHMAVATSKPQPAARRIIDHFGLAEFFVDGLESVFGADEAGVERPNKASVIEHALAHTPVVGGVDSIKMVGDREHDVHGAAEHGIKAVGVAWGYGAPGELAEAGARAIAQTPAELLDLL